MKWSLPTTIRPSTETSNVSDKVLVIAHGQMHIAHYDFMNRAWYTTGIAGHRVTIARSHTGVDCWVIVEWPKLARLNKDQTND